MLRICRRCQFKTLHLAYWSIIAQITTTWMIGRCYILLVLIIILHPYTIFLCHLSRLQINLLPIRPAKCAMRWFRQLVVGLSRRRPGFKPHLVLWDMCCTKWHCDRFFSLHAHSFIYRRYCIVSAIDSVLKQHASKTHTSIVECHFRNEFQVRWDENVLPCQGYHTLRGRWGINNG